jgi:hypothetical protein
MAIPWKLRNDMPAECFNAKHLSQSISAPRTTLKNRLVTSKPVSVQVGRFS